MSNKILFGITGSVSAFKAINLIRFFIKDGYECKAIITKGGLEFIKPELLVALGCPVYTDYNLDMYSYEQTMAHINLPRWADKIVVAPASANIIAKFATGFASDLLSQCLLANNNNSKVYIAPAMNINMWQNKLTQDNILKLQNLGFNIITPDQGLQACGDIGYGRLQEPEKLFKLLTVPQDFIDKKVLITVGATVEDIDGVRYLSNYSSGKMGFELVKELLLRGAQVIVLKAKTTIDFSISHHNLKIVETLSADNMNISMLELAKDKDIFIGCAAVADYKIKQQSKHKIKKDSETLILEFVKNPDILANCKKKYPDIFAVGFAAESQNILQYAKAKLEKKNLNMIVANSTSVLGEDNSSVTIFSKENSYFEFEYKSKQQIARDILDMIKKFL
ncbi:bifunctional phosphopantothenoylcysteine decarboxylase/phosphopantothenate--cysteine ligase CoaBC [Allofrancisella guangzhouensis]|uniref:Coenzyme A biosynthesis bifunctional protein CoaBC n=2 Tax=Pseudomonadota TaxID=1224 RepID=A0A0A8E4I9_9GAMM|nr:bifunctional phosphopantothenoylcysteine decarboxylase/phosphopantothenate--cysteine ligase CoaBC [Allofrancisella guangzhouensis]AJC49120.1 phosphopantothenoylcysteine decarboxylase [Allofrancisella guangzhouensis]MBK2026835.1 bifunctional phosphopantothenoylcysteine decarboxylase/phosphopantothenate--cysteine ligase CoaBC [Allofrancisella guangzhouensis]MBK2043585.1 bifunctional phosphopantothenoylcysteine decarboxylase/phosphopantothenate--cysteine ligase CoaBC [Allofrancisella guangzhouen